MVDRPVVSRVLSLAVASAALAFVPVSAGSRRVDVGGFRLNVRCAGQGSPTVILDAGAGDSSETWEWVVPDVRRFTRVCTYDRAGLGRSDPGPPPRTSERIASELGILLARARIPGPYVLVGHSFGGFNVRAFASLHPAEIAGLVLVDGTPEEFPAEDAELRSRGEREKLLTSRGIAPAAFLAELDAMMASAAYVRGLTPTQAQVIVLTAAHRDSSETFRAAWSALQLQMVQGFPHARQVIAEQSGHYIQFDQPELIVAAIRELVEAARAKPPVAPTSP